MILDGIDVTKLKRVSRYARTVGGAEKKSSEEKMSA